MSKKYECDNDKCTETTDCAESHWLVIGGADHSLYISNRLEGNQKGLSNWDEMHFCSQKCLLKKLFN